MAIDRNFLKRIYLRFKDLTILSLANLTSTGIGLIFWFYMTALLGPEKYGDLSYFIAIAAIASVITSIGSGNMLIVYTSKGIKLQSSVFLITGISGIVSSIVLFVIFNNIGVSVYTLGYIIFGLASSEILGLKMYKTYAKFLILQKVLMVCLSVGLYFLWGQNGVLLGLGLSFFPFVIKIVNTFRKIPMNFSLVKERIHFMLNGYILDLSRVFNGQIDKIIVYPLFGSILLGNYQLGLQVFSLSVMIPSIVYQYILPHDASGVRNIKLKKVTILFSIITSATGIVLAPFVIPIIFPEYIEAVFITQIILLATVPSSINMMYISKFLGSEKSRIVLIGSGVYLVVEISAILILGKIYGVIGVASALVLANTVETIYLILIDRTTRNKNI
jgi:O-antigen/teichoic acid export membrane protein